MQFVFDLKTKLISSENLIASFKDQWGGIPAWVITNILSPVSVRTLDLWSKGMLLSHSMYKSLSWFWSIWSIVSFLLGSKIPFATAIRFRSWFPRVMEQLFFMEWMSFRHSKDSGPLLTRSPHIHRVSSEGAKLMNFINSFNSLYQPCTSPIA